MESTVHQPLINEYQACHAREKYPGLSDADYASVREIVQKNVDALQKWGDKPLHPSIRSLLMQYIYVQDSPEWHAKRAQVALTSTELSMLMNSGATSANGRAALFTKKTYRSEPFIGNFFTEQGKLREDLVMDEYKRRSGKEVLTFGLLLKKLPNGIIVGGSPDGITPDGINVEIKTAHSRKIKPQLLFAALPDTPAAVIPDYYWYQTLMMMAVADIDQTHFIQEQHYSDGCGTNKIYATQDVWSLKHENTWNVAIRVLEGFYRDLQEYKETHRERYEADKRAFYAKRDQMARERELHGPYGSSVPKYFLDRPEKCIVQTEAVVQMDPVYPAQKWTKKPKLPQTPPVPPEPIDPPARSPIKLPFLYEKPTNILN